MCLAASWVSVLLFHSITIVQGKRVRDSSRRLAAAEFDGEGFKLAAGFFEGAGAVDFLGSETQFFFDGELSGDAAAGFRFTEATREEAVELLLGFAPGDDQAIKFFVDAGFDEECGLYEGRGACALALPFVEFAEDDFRDARMDDGVQTVELGAVAEDDGAELGAVDAATCVGDGRAEFMEDLVMGGLAGLNKFMGERIGVEDAKAHFAEHGSDGAFAAGDAAGKAESQHGRELPRDRGRLRGGTFG